MDLNTDNIFDDVSKLLNEEKKINSEKSSVDFDTDRFDSFIVKPEKLDNQVLYGIINLIELKISLYNTKFINGNFKITPDIGYKINTSMYVAYILENGIPVAVCTLRDPSTPDEYGVVIKDYVEMKTGVDLENRLEQEFFDVHPDYHDLGLAKELRRLIKLVANKTFIIIPNNDYDTIVGLKNAEYKMISTFKKFNENIEYQLWID